MKTQDVIKSIPYPKCTIQYVRILSFKYICLLYIYSIQSVVDECCVIG
jgi:hypothetical protein